jgi:hypothetical protein
MRARRVNVLIEPVVEHREDRHAQDRDQPSADDRRMSGGAPTPGAAPASAARWRRPAWWDARLSGHGDTCRAAARSAGSGRSSTRASEKARRAAA